MDYKKGGTIGLNSGALFALLSSFVLLAGCVSLGDTEGFTYVSGWIDNLEVTWQPELPDHPLENISIEIDIVSSSNEFRYFQSRDSLYYIGSYIYNFYTIKPLYTCFDASYGLPGKESYVCPDNFNGMESVAKLEAEIALKKTGVVEEQFLPERHLPLAFLLVNNRTVESPRIENARSPSYSELFEIGKSPRKIFDRNDSVRNLTVTAQLNSTDSVCVKTGLPPQRIVSYKIRSDLPLKNYTLSGRVSAPTENRSVGNTHFFYFYDNDRENLEITTFETCFGE